MSGDRTGQAISTACRARVARMKIPGALLVSLAFIVVPSTPASAAPNPLNAASWAQRALEQSVGQRFDRMLDVNRARCRRRGAARFRCTFKAVNVDTRWIGRGTVRFRGRGLFTYDVRGRVEECVNISCEKTGTFHWTGRAAPFG